MSKFARATAVGVATVVLFAGHARANEPQGPPDRDMTRFERHGTIGASSWPTSLTRCTDGKTALVEGVTPGRVFALSADAGSWQNDFDVAFFGSADACRAGTPSIPYTNHAGDERSVVPQGAAVAMVSLRHGDPGAAFTYVELGTDPASPRTDYRAPTVIAIIEPVGPGTALEGNGFSPYYEDFLGSKQPWNADTNPLNNIDFDSSPKNYLPDYPEATALPIHYPQSSEDNVNTLSAKDALLWSSVKASTAEQPNVYWFPGTKVVAAAKFGDSSYLRQATTAAEPAHATKSASVSGGNINGTCPECLLVFVGYDGKQGRIDALKWVAAQPWIDVVNNSYHESVVFHDGIYLGGQEAAISRSAVEAGQMVFWGAGNGWANTLGDVPNITYGSSQSGPDWGITVGGVTVYDDQNVRGAGRPADIASYVDDYPSVGGVTAGGKSTFGGTSNAGPVAAGTFARVIQLGRDLLGATTSGHRDGVVATGEARPCPTSGAPCPLGDGELRRDEVEAIVFGNVLPSPTRQRSEVTAPSLPAAPAVGAGVPGGDAIGPGVNTAPAQTQPAIASYIDQGHGIIYGRKDASRFVAEQRRLSDALRGAFRPFVRPPGEQTWMKVDSKCRKQLWGQWNGGYYQGVDPVFDVKIDGPAMAVDAWCSLLPQDAFANAPDTSYDVPQVGVNT